MKRLRTLIATGLMLVVLTACGGPPSLVGTWRADDGTGVKVFRSDGQCSGMMYFRAGDPTDVGGGIPMYCLLSSEKDSSGRYTLEVTQSFSGFTNQVRLKVAMNGKDEAKVYDNSGALILTLKKH